jgi:phosphohistidine phosphatase
MYPKNMKRLFVLRHAKSSWADAGISDFERPLNDRGTAAAPLMGTVMRRRGFEPEAILSSPAERAKQTAAAAREAAGFAAGIRFDERIYEASTQTLINVLSELGSERSALIVGHNPGMEGLVRALTGRSESMPTAALAVIDLDIDDWASIKPGSGTLLEVIRPKDMQQA